ncbi:MAG: hypothetical protein WDZ77_00325 [Candidatus Pacearchaeota archaeon]
MKNKKGQLKIQQMAFMLLAVTLFFALVGLLVLSFQISNLRDTAGTLEERNALLLVTKLSNSPEFSCGRAFGNARTNCIDADKAMILKSQISKYDRFWDVEEIEIRKIYPPQTIDEGCSFENYPNCNLIKVLEGSGNSVGYSNFVSLCRKERVNEEIRDKCELAKLIVSYNAE